MPVFNVFLARTYKVQIEASDEAVAERLAEEFVSDVEDISTNDDRVEHRFHIQSIEMVDNNAFDAIELESS